MCLFCPLSSVGRQHTFFWKVCYSTYITKTYENTDYFCEFPWDYTQCLGLVSDGLYVIVYMSGEWEKSTNKGAKLPSISFFYIRVCRNIHHPLNPTPMVPLEWTLDQLMSKKTGEKGAAALLFDVTTALTKNVMWNSKYKPINTVIWCDWYIILPIFIVCLCISRTFIFVIVIVICIYYLFVIQKSVRLEIL